MSGFLSLDEYHNAVESSLKKIPWVKTVGVYPEIPDGFETPAIFFEVESWEHESDSVAGAAMSIIVQSNLYVLREFEADLYGRKARNAALYLSNWIQGRQFGEMTKPAEFISAEEATWNQAGKAVSSHCVWAVSLSQEVHIGEDPYAPDDDVGRLKEVWLGKVPDVGLEHIEDYRLIARAKDD